jgi:peroxiredoxin
MNFLGRPSGDQLTYTANGHRATAPDLTGIDSNGNLMAVADLRGRVILFTFWKAGCDACDKEMRWFSEFQQTYGDHDFVFLQRKIESDKDLVNLRPQAIPTTLLIDKSGSIAVTHVGLCPKREYQTAIETLLNER